MIEQCDSKQNRSSLGFLLVAMAGSVTERDFTLSNTFLSFQRQHIEVMVNLLHVHLLLLLCEADVHMCVCTYVYLFLIK